MSTDFFDDIDLKPQSHTPLATGGGDVNTSPYDTIYIPFGKYRDMTLLDVAESDASYLHWMRKALNKGFFDSLYIRAWIEENEEHFDDAINVVAQIKVATAEPLTLTDHQQTIVDQLLDLIEKGHNIIRLEGGAGYGKSFVTRAVAAALIKMGYIVHGMAVSYVATGVLRDQLGSVGATCNTVASSLKFSKTFNEGVETYEFSEETPEAACELLKDMHALVFDECSMGENEVAELLFDHCNQGGGLLILVGDSKQLPPVKQDSPSICCTPWESGVVRLTEPMRYNIDSVLYKVEQTARNSPHALTQFLSSVSGPEVTVTRTADEFFKAYVDSYRASPEDTHRMMLFKRKDVTAANAEIRKALHGDDAYDIVDDERLMVITTSDYPYAKNNAERVNTTRYYSGENFRVAEVDFDVYFIRIGSVLHEIDHYIVTFEDRDSRVRILFSESDTKVDSSKPGSEPYADALQAARAQASAIKTFNRTWGSIPILDQTREQKETLADIHGVNLDAAGNAPKPWDAYMQLKNDFVRVAYCYATSVHRAQGQTVDHAYCVPSQLMAVGGLIGDALTYVGATRARKHLTVLL